MSDTTNPGEEALDTKESATAAATDRAASKVSPAVDHAGDNTPTKPGTEAAKASAGTNEREELRQHPVPKS